MAREVGILMYPASPAQRDQWQRLLAGAAVSVLPDPPAVDELDQIEVVLLGPGQTAHPALAPRVKDGRVGVVAFDADVPADVLLPGDTSPRELQLACQLLGEIVRLRRQQRRSERSRQSMEDLALTDHLTAIPNRRAWDAATDGWPGGLLVLLDLDHFKVVNDRLGYEAGDQVLKQAAERLRSNVRGEDLVARLGGDEFGLLLSASALANGFEVVDRIRRSVSCSLADEVSLTASAGFAVVQPGENSSRLMASADHALRRAKALGRDRTVRSDAPS